MSQASFGHFNRYLYYARVKTLYIQVRLLFKCHRFSGISEARLLPLPEFDREHWVFEALSLYTTSPPKR